ncbi:unnamed protein product [Orchesella dallaii]|uniref:Micro-fibrillar-associated protein 1 C-terminal domain-containing protein n=1 Tax=Orchesella dallaii TaxID=48710 RepID=A0ABP1PW42_9HEXA
MPKNSHAPAPIQSTAGAIPVKNEKGQVSMQKVKVSRYVSGKRPEYAPRSSSEDESEEEEFIGHQRFKHDDDDLEDDEDEMKADYAELERSDPRLRRLMTAESGSRSRSRRVEEPEVLDADRDSDVEYREPRRHESESESEEEEVDEMEAEQRRAYIRERMLERREEEELLDKEEDKEPESDESESEYEEYTDSEEEARPRLKPVFVRRDERITVKDKDTEDITSKQIEEQQRSKHETRRKETLKIIEAEVEKERKRGGSDDESEATMPKITDVATDDENEEAEYEAWKVRELKRIKRDRDEREAYERERMEIERMHNLTEEERRLEMKLKPKQILNKASKGKYKFLQKYYHRGVFFLDKEEDVFRRDFSQPTLEDHFDKTILPKVMQVKNFGRSGRTKYTHLVDQDTTNFESAWVGETAQNMKFHHTNAAGVRQNFDKPSFKRSKADNTPGMK